jgi:hypothetical protein
LKCHQNWRSVQFVFVFGLWHWEGVSFVGCTLFQLFLRLDIFNRLKQLNDHSLNHSLPPQTITWPTMIEFWVVLDDTATAGQLFDRPDKFSPHIDDSYFCTWTESMKFSRWSFGLQFHFHISPSSNHKGYIFISSSEPYSRNCSDFSVININLGFAFFSICSISNTALRFIRIILPKYAHHMRLASRILGVRTCTMQSQKSDISQTCIPGWFSERLRNRSISIWSQNSAVSRFKLTKLLYVIVCPVQKGGEFHRIVITILSKSISSRNFHSISSTLSGGIFDFPNWSVEYSGTYLLLNRTFF